MSNIRLTLKAARVLNNLSQREVAKLMGVHVDTYRKWEKRPDTITIGTAKKLAEVLNVDYNDIFFGSD